MENKCNINSPPMDASYSLIICDSASPTPACEQRDLSAHRMHRIQFPKKKNQGGRSNLPAATGSLGANYEHVKYLWEQNTYIISKTVGESLQLSPAPSFCSLPDTRCWKKLQVSGPRVLLIDDGALLSADSALHHKSPGRCVYCIVRAVYYAPVPQFCVVFCSDASIHRFSFHRAQRR
jgi:hypothetical protein